MTTDQHPGLQRTIQMRLKQQARREFIHGDETIEELAARFQIDKGELTKKSNAEGWKSQRKRKREELARRLDNQTGVAVTERRADFLLDLSEMLGTLGGLIKAELERIKNDEPNKLGIPPTFADTNAVAAGLLKFAQAGKVAFAIPDKIEVDGRKMVDGGFIDVEPLSSAEVNDPFAIELPPKPQSPLTE